ncbi:MAG: hypothetical protein ACXQTS_05990 [Candidatus Methanospirareceae archaeon]
MGRKITIPKYKIREIQNLRRQGFSYVEIAKDLKVSIDTVLRYAKDINPSVDGGLPKSEVDKILDLWEKGYSKSQIAKLTRHSYPTVLKYIKKYGKTHTCPVCSSSQVYIANGKIYCRNCSQVSKIEGDKNDKSC